MSQPDVFVEVEGLLLESDPTVKALGTIEARRRWQEAKPEIRAQRRPVDPASLVKRLQSPGRPSKPELLDPRQLPRRGLGSPAGRIGLLHSLAHIEFNAINLALDAVYRFRDFPLEYVDDWYRVASDEGEHFLLLQNRLQSLGCRYGDLPAHDGLWEMALRTDHDALVRMALVPRILEARGLDVAPPMIEKLKSQGDLASAEILQRIYTDEITHVEVGNRWFRYLCEQQQLDGVVVFRDLLKGKASAYLRSPYNDKARLQAGFTEAEMQLVREMETEYRLNTEARQSADEQTRETCEDRNVL